MASISAFQDVVTKILVIALYIVGGFSFIILVQSDNNAPQPIIDNTRFNNTLIGLNGNLSSLDTDSQVQYTQFNNETPQAGFGSIVLFGIVAAGKTFSNVALGIVYGVISFPLVILGIPTNAISVAITYLIITLIVAVWLLYKLGG